MRIAELKPTWLERDGRLACFLFLCPHCVAEKREKPVLLACSVFLPWASVFPQHDDEVRFLDAWLAQQYPGYTHADVVPPARRETWQKRGTWDSLSVVPSINASASGHWHGSILNGEITAPQARPAVLPKAAPAPRGIRCFFLEPCTPNRYLAALRRYSHTDGCKKNGGRYHQGEYHLGELEGEPNLPAEHPANEDQRWPSACACGYRFAAEDPRSYSTHYLYRRQDTGELMTLHDAPAGAMWFAPWYSDNAEWRGPDGNTLVVRLPPDGHDWIVDSRARNCGMPDDKVHKCWIRHGTPPDVTVDKRGHTCKAGAGSIKTDKWHGFLRGGYLVT